jgi:chaperone modulatory protein CbpM
MSDRRQAVQGIVIEESVEVTFDELCQACAVRREWLVELVEEGVLEPHGPVPEHWRFPAESLRRARIVCSLQRDLGLNLAGAALALELLEENEAMRARLARLSASHAGGHD